MLFVGTGQDEDELQKLIKKYKLSKDITLCGRICDREILANYYARSDLLLFPSLYDTSSLVQIEAASQKTPTLFIEGAATNATATNNVNGFIAKNDVLEYAKSIIKIMNNKKTLTKVGNNAYRDLYKNWDTLVKEVYKNYLELTKKISN
jgi:glycosyltransferase involved in cell wall biosynthesis